MSGNLKKTVEECPDAETLSAHLDGEVKLEPVQLHHISSCSKCARRLEEFSKVSAALKEAIDAATPDDIAARIRKGVALKLADSMSTSMDFPLWASRIAATIAVCALGSFLVFRTLKDSAHHAPEADASTTAVSQSVPALKPVAKDASIGPANTGNIVPSASRPIDLDEISSVSFGGDDARRLVAGSIPSKQAPALISPSVRHVWLAEGSPDDVLAKLHHIEHLIGIKSGQTSFDKSPDGLDSSFQLTRRQAAMLVRAFHSSGFKLLSPQQPQPEQRAFIGSGSEPVFYKADFISSQK